MSASQSYALDNPLAVDTAPKHVAPETVDPDVAPPSEERGFAGTSALSKHKLILDLIASIILNYYNEVCNFFYFLALL